MSTVWQNVLNGLSFGSVYALFALGYTLIFSILRIINFAHGAVFTAGAYFTYALMGKRMGGGNYVFSNKVLEKLIGPVFDHIANTFIDRFVERAESLHAPPTT